MEFTNANTSYMCQNCGAVYAPKEIKLGFALAFDRETVTYTVFNFKEPLMYSKSGDNKQEPQCKTCGIDLGAIIQYSNSGKAVMTNPKFVPLEYEGLGTA